MSDGTTARRPASSVCGARYDEYPIVRSNPIAATTGALRYVRLLARVESFDSDLIPTRSRVVAVAAAFGVCAGVVSVLRTVAVAEGVSLLDNWFGGAD